MFDACISVDDCDAWETKKADKHHVSDEPHTCCECGETIEPGTEHDLWIPVCEDDVDENDPDKYHPDDVCGFSEEPCEFHTCVGCKRIWAGLGDGTFVPGALNEYLDYSNGISCNHDYADYDGNEQFEDISGRNRQAERAAEKLAAGESGEFKVVAAMTLLDSLLTDEQFRQVVEIVMSVEKEDT